MFCHEMISYSKLALWVQMYNVFSSEPINSAEKAKELGEYIVHKLIDGIVDFSRYPNIRVTDYVEEWCIAFSLPRVPERDFGNGFFKSRAMFGGGGPEIHLDKNTGKIVRWGLQK